MKNKNYSIEVNKEKDGWKVLYSFKDGKDSMEFTGFGKTYEDACEDVIEQTIQWYDNQNDYSLRSMSNDELIGIIENLQEDMKENDLVIESLNADLEEYENELDHLDEVINTQAEEITSLKKTNSDLRDHIAYLEEYIDNFHIDQNIKEQKKDKKEEVSYKDFEEVLQEAMDRLLETWR